MTNIRRWHPPTTKAIQALFMAAGTAVLSACAQLPGTASPSEKTAQTAPMDSPETKPEDLYQWNGDGRKVSRIEIDVDKQKAIFYNGSEQIGWTMVASGIRYFATPKGRFTISEKVADKRSNLYGRIYDRDGKLLIVNARRGVHRIPPGGRFRGAKMPYFMRLTKGGVGMHGGPIPEPGDPASHGCIRMPHALAATLYDHVRIGTPVRVLGSGPS